MTEYRYGMREGRIASDEKMRARATRIDNVGGGANRCAEGSEAHRFANIQEAKQRHRAINEIPRTVIGIY